MTTHNIEPVRETLHGTFSREYPAILTIDSGDTVHFRTLISSWIIDYTKDPPEYFEPRVKGRDGGHALCGPVAIRGAQPGMTLEVRINEVRPAQWGLTASEVETAPLIDGLAWWSSAARWSGRSTPIR